jgi:hypothetical protein
MEEVMLQIEKLWVVILAAIGAFALAGLKRYMWDEMFKYTKKKRAFQISVDISKNINHILWPSLHAFGATRIIVAEFHNGGEYLSQLTMLKASVTYEVTDEGVSSMQQELQNINLKSMDSLIRAFFDTELKEADTYLYKNHDTAPTQRVLVKDVSKVSSPFIRALLHKYGVKIAVVALIKDPVSDMPLGLYGITFDKAMSGFDSGVALRYRLQADAIAYELSKAIGKKQGIINKFFTYWKPS